MDPASYSLPHPYGRIETDMVCAMTKDRGHATDHPIYSIDL